MTSEKLISREFLLVSAIGFLIALNFFTLLAVIPRYSVEVFHLNETQAGFASGLFLIGMMSSRMLAGALVNRIGFRKMIAISIIGLVGFSCGYFFADSPTLLFGIRFLNGFAYGMAANTGNTIISVIVPRSRSGEGVGYYSLFMMIAWAVGPYIGVDLSQTGDYSSIFLLCAFLPAIGLFFLPALRLPTIQPVINEGGNRKPTLPGNFFESCVVPFAITNSLMGLFLANITGFISLFSDTIGLGSVAPYYFIVYVVFLTATRPVVSRLIDRKGANIVFFPGAALAFVSFILVSKVEQAPMLIISAAIMGMGFGAVQNAMLALVVKTAARERLGVANATYFLFLDISAAAGPVIGGALIEAVGYRDMYMTGAAMTAIGFLCYISYLGRKKRSV